MTILLSDQAIGVYAAVVFFLAVWALYRHLLRRRRRAIRPNYHGVRLTKLGGGNGNPGRQGR